MGRHIAVLRRNAPGIILIALVYLALVLPTVDRQDINWDEQDDLNIATSYLSWHGMFRGSTADSINTRLPMALGAVVFALRGGPDLHAARLLSVGVGVLTLVGVWLLCAEGLDRRKALLAGLVLASSPYFLAYSKLAFTEGDAIIACATVWTLVAAAHLARRPRVGAAVLAGLALGLALSAKISALALFPPVLLWLLLVRPVVEEGDAPVSGLGLREAWPALGLAALFVAGHGAALWLAHRGAVQPGSRRALLDLAGVGSVWMALLLWGWVRREAPLRRSALVVVPLIVGTMTFFVLPPVHTTNPENVLSILDGFFAGGRSFNPALALEASAFHFLVVLIKPSVVIGAFCWIACLVAWRGGRGRSLRMLTLLTIAGYCAFLVTLPWVQTRYMMPAFALIVVLGADAAVDLFDRHRRKAQVLAIFAVAFLAADLAQTYPDYNLNGYQWLGAEYLAGRSTLGYRGIAQVPSDGIQEALRWTEQNAGPDDRVVAFIAAHHIVRATCPAPRFQLVDGLDKPSIRGATYVVTSINEEIHAGFGTDNPRGDDIFRYPYDRRALERDFVRVFSVRRAFGVEVAAVWRRHPVTARMDRPE